MGLFAKMPKGVFLYVLGLQWFCFFFLVFLCFCFVKKAQYKKGPKRLFSCNFRVFVLFCSPIRPVFKFLLFFLFCFLFLILLSSLAKFHFFLFLFVHQPLFGNIIIFGLFCFSFSCLFPFLMFACFFETYFPNIPFLKLKLLSFLAVLCLLLLLFLVSWCVFLPFCFYVGFVLGNFLVFIFCCFVLFLVMLSVYGKKHCFPCNSGVF